MSDDIKQRLLDESFKGQEAMRREALARIEALEAQLSAIALASLPAPEAAPTREGRHPVESLWRECGLPEYFLGNDGSNTKLYALYEAILALKSAPAK